MRFKMNRLSKAIKRGLVSTEGPTPKAIDLFDSCRSVLEALGCWGCCYFSVLRQQLRDEGRPISSAHSATLRLEPRSGVSERYCCAVARGSPACLTGGHGRGCLSRAVEANASMMSIWNGNVR